ncbi:MAG TPA: glycosyltransferase family 9 protein [Bryobacteraceae bacterium]|nr:glycosyltransferase family 9 protein [Bryobacteraceae bacterium]
MIRRLLIRPGAIGDFILSLPALEALREDYTEVWCAGQNVPLARFADRAQSIVSAGMDRLGLLPADDVIARLRGFDSIISWYGANRPEFRELVRDLHLPVTFLPALPDGRCHAVEFYNAEAMEISGRRASRFPVLPCPPVPRTFAAIHPFASGPAKRAPMAVFDRIAARLSKTMPVHWLCGPEESLEGALRISDLYELACWLRGARIFAGNDSGISHLAAAVGTPVLALFRTTNPLVWAPRGPSVNVIGVA